MKTLNVVPLLLLLFLIIPRNSSANPDAQAVASSSSKTINGMITGTERLTAVFKWLDDNVKSSKFDESILALKNAVYSLPSDLGVDRQQILERLSKAADRIIITRVTLEEAATTQKEYSKELIYIYESNDVSKELLQYTADKFVKYSKAVLDIIQDSSNRFTEIGDELSRITALLQVLSSTLVEKEEDIKALKKKEMGIEEQVRTLHNQITEIKRKQEERNRELNKIRKTVAISTLGIGCIFSEPVIAIIRSEEEKGAEIKVLQRKTSLRDVQNKLEQNKKKLERLKVTVTNAQSSALALTDGVVDIKTYVVEEINLINQWKYSLTKAILDQEDITILDIQFGIKGIKDRLNDLIKACDTYLNHKLPDIRDGLISGKGIYDQLE